MLAPKAHLRASLVVSNGSSNFFSMGIANNVFLDMDSLFQFRTSILFFSTSCFASVSNMGGPHCPPQCSKFQLKIAWKFSKLPGKMLGSCNSQLGTQNATNMAWNVVCTFQPTDPG